MRRNKKKIAVNKEKKKSLPIRLNFFVFGRVSYFHLDYRRAWHQADRSG